ncbi:MAG: hypothetical protein HYX24_04270 [Candidatus Aenigmarchaeota archaeon]|nr:hypothetical protein [Candidatus Aenigmarchaeota archaeon]
MEGIGESSLFESKDRKLLPLFLLSLVLISVIVGNFFSTFFTTLISVFVLSLIYSAIKIRALNHDLFMKFKETCYILAFSLLTTLIFAVVFPFIIFHDSFSSIYVINFIYGLPVVFVFFFCLYFFGSLLKEEWIEYGYFARNSLLLSVILAVISFILAVWVMNYIFESQTSMFYETYGHIAKQQEETTNLYHEGQVFVEINEYHDNFLEEAKMQMERTEAFESERGACVLKECEKVVIDNIYNSIVFAVTSHSIETSLGIANNETAYIESELFKENFTSLEEYLGFLKENVEYLSFNLTPMSNDEREDLRLLESDFSYNEGRKLYEKYILSNKGEIFFNLFPEPDSIFSRSLFYVAEHSAFQKHLIRTAAKTQIYLQRISINEELPAKLYNGRYANESIESKIIRYKILKYWIERFIQARESEEQNG